MVDAPAPAASPLPTAGGGGPLPDQVRRLASGRIAFLDYLRIAAFASVLVGHKFTEDLYAYMADPARHATPKYLASLLMPFVENGGFGVVLFFLISGFIITHVLYTENPAEFAIKRVFRIYPLYIAAALLQFGLVGYPNHTRPDSSTFIHQLTLFGDFSGTPYALNGVEWTLRIEILFYIVMGALRASGAFGGPRRLLTAALAVLTLLPGFLPPFPQSPGLLLGYLTIYAPFLFLGAVFYMHQKGSCGLQLLTLLTALTLTEHYWKIETVQPNWINHHFTSLACAAFASAYFLRDRIATPRWVYWLSSLTYAVYLTHNWALELILGNLHAPEAPATTRQKLGALALLLALCWILSISVEKYGIKLGKVISSRFKTPPRGEAAGV